MPIPPTISDAEWEVMNVLWESSPQTANQVVEALAGKKNWNPRTVKTLLNRLVKKKALGFEAVGKSYLYRPAIAREQCLRSEARSFVDRVFGGAAGPMIAYFVQNTRLSDEEIAELKRILSEKKR
jgi:BlaI family transcriptional regulator, penicillinase repressor